MSQPTDVPISVRTWEQLLVWSCLCWWEWELFVFWLAQYRDTKS